MLLAGLTACERSSADADGESPGEAGVVTYQVRGRVLEAWEGDDRVALRHEAIPELVGREGEVEGMNEMSMRFPVREGLDLEALEVGAAVQFVLSVDWTRRPPHRIESLELLGPDVDLDLSR